jgi:hypothetical protein
VVARKQFSDDDAWVCKNSRLTTASSCNEMTRASRKFFFLSALGLMLSACGGQLYKVATPPKGAPPPLAATDQGLVAAAKVLAGDEAMEQFDANLLLAGVVPVDVRLANRTAANIPLGPLRWELKDGGATLFKLLPPKKALKRVMGFYGNRLYRPAAYQHTFESYERLALPLATTLEPQAELRGFLFFETKYEATNLRGLTLTISGQGDPLQVKLN